MSSKPSLTAEQSEARSRPHPVHDELIKRHDEFGAEIVELPEILRETRDERGRKILAKLLTCSQRVVDIPDEHLGNARRPR